jgi:hypothetical protein
MVGVSHGYRTATNYADMIASPLGISMSKLMGEEDYCPASCQLPSAALQSLDYCGACK